MFEACQFLNLTRFNEENLMDQNLPGIAIFNKSLVHDIILEVIKILKKLAPEKLHPCPLTGDFFHFLNYQSDWKQEHEKIMPDGDYRFDHKFWNDEDEKVFEFNVYETFKTREKSFF